MFPSIPAYLTVLEAILRLSAVAFALGLIWIGAWRAQGPARSRYAAASLLSIVLGLWLALAWHFGTQNVYFATAGSAISPALPLALLGPLIVAALLFGFSNGLSRIAAAMPLPLLAAAQLYRVGGGIFLVLMAEGRLPWQFALPAGIGDVATGAFAIVVARLLARNAPGAVRAAYGWSLFGIADLVVAVAMGMMTSPGPFHVLALDAPNLLVTSYPLVMVPTFAVPLALILHGLVLWRLRRESVRNAALAAA